MHVLAAAIAANAVVALVASQLGAEPAPTSAAQASRIIGKMQASYAQVEGYQTETEVRVYRAREVAETRRFLYTFKKPNRIRLDFETPHHGMVVTYPDRHGKSVVKLGGWLGIVSLHLAPDGALLQSSGGQRIDQTDLGLLIQNIAHSLTDHRRGEMRIEERNGQGIIEVLADDHFLPGVQTLYRFTIDETCWLPSGVSEFTPEGALKRDVVLENLRTTTGTAQGSDNGRPEP